MVIMCLRDEKSSFIELSTQLRTAHSSDRSQGMSLEQYLCAETRTSFDEEGCPG